MVRNNVHDDEQHSIHTTLCVHQYTHTQSTPSPSPLTTCPHTHITHTLHTLPHRHATPLVAAWLRIRCMRLRRRLHTLEQGAGVGQVSLQRWWAWCIYQQQQQEQQQQGVGSTAAAPTAVHAVGTAHGRIRVLHAVERGIASNCMMAWTGGNIHGTPPAAAAAGGGGGAGAIDEDDGTPPTTTTPQQPQSTYQSTPQSTPHHAQSWLSIHIQLPVVHVVVRGDAALEGVMAGVEVQRVGVTGVCARDSGHVQVCGGVGG